MRAAWATQVTGLRQMFADQAEERRLAADDSIATDQDEFEAFAAGILATCDATRVAESATLEQALVARRTAFDGLLAQCREAISAAIDEQIDGLKNFLQTQYGYAGHAPGPYKAVAPEDHDGDYAGAVQEYVAHVTAPQGAQAAAAIAWLGQKKEALKENIAATEDNLEQMQTERAHWEADGFADEVTGWIDENGTLAATLLEDIQLKNDAAQATLEDLKHKHYGYQDAHGYRYKLLHQLHHQKVAFEQAIESAWTTWTQARDLTLATASSTAGTAAEAFELFLANRLGEWEGAAQGVREALGGQLAEKGEALKGAVQQATKVFQEKQAYKRHYIADLPDQHKAALLTKKVDLEDQLYQEAVQAIWANFGGEGRATLEWLDTFLNAEGDDLEAAQDAAGNLLSGELADELERIGEALSAIGDAFFQAKHDEADRLDHALHHYGYGDYKHGYEPVFKHDDEEVEDPHHQTPEVVPEPEVEYPVTAPEPIVVVEPEPVYISDDESLVEEHVSEESDHHSEEESDHHSEDSDHHYYYEDSHSSDHYSSDSSHHFSSDSSHHYDHVKPYKPSRPYHHDDDHYEPDHYLATRTNQYSAGLPDNV